MVGCGCLLVGSGCPPLDEMGDRRCDHSSCERSVDRFPVGILPIRLTKVPSPYEARVIILAGPLTLGFALVVKVLDPGDFVSVYDPLALNNAQGAGPSVYAGVGTKT